MRLYNQQHRFYAGVDLHARSLSTHILDQRGRTVFERDLPASPDTFLDAVRPFRKGLVVGCECMFAWYWLADLCEDLAIPFVLGHALDMKMIHGGKAKNDRIDAAKLAGLLKGGLFPMAYVYPRAKRQTRDLLRRRSFFVRQRAQLIAHIQIVRLPEAGHFLSYARLVRCAHESAGKVQGTGGKKIGNAHLKWALSEAACLMIRSYLPVKGWLQRQEKKRGKRKALSLLEAKLGRAVYHLQRKQVPFDSKRFLHG